MVSVPYYALQEGLLGGRTLGKRLTGVKVVRAADGAPVGFGRAFVRSVMRFVDGLPFLYLLGWFVAAVSEERRRLGDLLAGTAVVNVRETVVPPIPPRGGEERAGPWPSVAGSYGATVAEEAEALRRRQAAGEEGERIVREALPLLPGKGCYLFGNIPDRAFGDVDNLVVAPSGVWVFDAKSHGWEVSADPHGGHLLRNGEPFEKDFYGQIKRQADHVTGALSGWRERRTVRWMICFSRARLVPGPDGKWPLGVCAPEYLVGVITARARPCTTPTRSRGSPTTWSGPTGCVPEPRRKEYLRGGLESPDRVVR